MIDTTGQSRLKYYVALKGLIVILNGSKSLQSMHFQAAYELVWFKKKNRAQIPILNISRLKHDVCTIASPLGKGWLS